MEKKKGLCYWRWREKNKLYLKHIRKEVHCDALCNGFAIIKCKNYRPLTSKDTIN